MADARCSGQETAAAIGAKNALRRQSSMSASRLRRRIASDGTMPWLIISDANLHEARAAELRALDERQRVGEDVELSERPLRRRGRCVRPVCATGASAIIFRMITRAAEATGPPRAHQTTAAEDARPRARRRRFEARRFRAPRGRRPRAQRDGVDVSRGSAGGGERLAKIELPREAPRWLPGAAGRSARRPERQPACEQFFAEMGTRARKQLEQRGGAEDVEIARVQMIARRENARRSRRCPAIGLRDARCRLRKSRSRGSARSSARSTRSCQTARPTNAAIGMAKNQAGCAARRNTSHALSAVARHCGKAAVADARVEAGEARMFRARRPPCGIHLEGNRSNRRGSPCDPI